MKKACSVTATLFAILLVALCPAAMAKNTARKKPVKARSTWNAAVKVEAKAWYDTNTFLLSDRQKTRLQSANPDDQISGRFTEMNSVSDYVFRPSAQFLAEGPGIAGRKMLLEAGAHYDLYALNPRRRHFSLDFAVEQSTSRNGRMRVKFEYMPSYFYRNYLADATNSTSSVLPSERVYKPDVYSEWDITADYRYRLGDGKVALLGRAGYLQRHDRAPFVGHDRNAPHFGGGVNFDLTPWWRVDGNYDFVLVDSPHVQEVMILNEPDFNVDFNNDGNTSDMSIRTVQFVDRRHHEQFFRASTKLGIREKSYLDIGYERRHRNFLSKEPFDIFHNGRTDNRDTMHIAFVSHFGQSLQFTTGYNYSFENSNLPSDPGVTGEVNNYNRGVGYAGLSYRF
jgi:hypothetical protein